MERNLDPDGSYSFIIMVRNQKGSMGEGEAVYPGSSPFHFKKKRKFTNLRILSIF